MPLITQALTTLANAKQHLNIAPSDTTQDARLELFINAATARLETMTDRRLKAVALTELQHGGQQNILLLKQFPINSVTEIRVDVNRAFGTDTILPVSEYSVGDDNSTIIFDGYLPRGLNVVRVLYVAGYNSTDHAGNLAELEMACLWLVEWFYRHRDRADMGRTSKSKGDESVGILAQMPPMIAEIVHSYTRMEAPIANLLTGNV
jgi:hypothetical protein